MAFLTMERLGQPVAIYGNGFRLISRFSLLGDVRWVASGGDHGLHKGSILCCPSWRRRAVMTRVRSIHMWAAMRKGAGRIGRASVVSESGRMKSNDKEVQG